MSGEEDTIAGMNSDVSNIPDITFESSISSKEEIDFSMIKTSLTRDTLIMSPLVSISDVSLSTSLSENLTPRRLSTRIKAKPAFYEASPETLLKQVETTIENMGEESQLKKPQPLVKRKKIRNVLEVRTKKKKRDTNLSAGNEDPSLYEIVKNGNTALLSAVNDWMDSYNQDKVKAMVVLLQFFVTSSGCNGTVSQSMVEEEDTAIAIRQLTQNFDEQTENYPLIINNSEFKKFKSNFASFIIHLMNQCQYNIIYDDYMMEILLTWIFSLSDSQVRGFRHTSTFAGLKIMTGIIDVVLKVEVELSNMQHQLDDEEAKPSNKQSRDKVDKLKRRRNELNQNKTKLEDMMNNLLNTVFVVRYRDIWPGVRVTCFAEMGCWMQKHSQFFLESNLKYLGWSLYDKVAEVRLQVLQTLQDLYQNSDFIEKFEQLGSFTARFKSRLIHMTLDADTNVAVEAINIATLLYKYNALDVDDYNQVEQLVFCDHVGMAHSAGSFLTSRVLQLSIDCSPSKMRKGQKQEFTGQMNLKAILNFFLKTDVHENCAYIVDSLWEHTPLVKDWKTMTNLLLDENCLIELEDDEEKVLIDFMCCACKQAATGAPPPGRQTNKKLTQKDRKVVMEDKKNISYHFMEHLPQLLEKYKTDVVKVDDLLSIIQHFDLELYDAKLLTKLLDHIVDVVLKTADQELLLTCSKTLSFLRDNDLLISQSTEISLNKIMDVVVENFHKNISASIPKEGESTESNFNIVSNLRKIAALYRYHNLSDWGLYDGVNSILNQAVIDSVHEESLLLSLEIIYMYILMQFNAFGSNTPNKAAAKRLRKQQNTFVRQADELLQFGAVQVKNLVFLLLCDYFVIFARQILNFGGELVRLVFEANSNLQVRMRDYIISSVFNEINEDEIVEDEEDDLKAEELDKKRTMLAGLCKLFSYGIFDIKLAAPIFGQFLRAYADYSDIIKQLMSHCREINLSLYSKVLLFTLQQTFDSLLEDHDGVIDTKNKKFYDLKDLARRFALMLGVNINLDQSRKTTIVVHKEGINYAFKACEEESDIPPNLLFLEVLQEFTYRLIKVDRKKVLLHLDAVGGEMLNSKRKEWQPVRTYRNGLLHTSEMSSVDEHAEGEVVCERKRVKQRFNRDGGDEARRRLSMRSEKKAKTPAETSENNIEGASFGTSRASSKKNDKTNKASSRAGSIATTPVGLSGVAVEDDESASECSSDIPDVSSQTLSLISDSNCSKSPKKTYTMRSHGAVKRVRSPLMEDSDETIESPRERRANKRKKMLDSSF